MELTSKNVEKVFKDCLFLDDENHDNYIKAEGITLSVGFHPERLKSYREDVRTMLQCLPIEFQRTPEGEGGWSFLNACNDKDGKQWTGEQKIMEQLFLLGISLNLAQWLMPKEMWSALPGGVPYVVVL